MATRKKLGEILVENGAATPDVIRRALGHQRQWGGKLGRILVEMDAVTDDQLARALGAQSRMPLAKMKDDTPYEIASLVPVDVAERHVAVAFGLRSIEEIETVYVAIADPFDVVGMDEIRFAVGKPVKFAVAPADEIRRAIARIRDMSPAAPAGRASAPSHGHEPRSAPARAATRGARQGVPLARIQIAQAPAPARTGTRPPAKAITPPPLDDVGLESADDMEGAIDHSSPAEVLAEMVAKSSGYRTPPEPAPRSDVSGQFRAAFLPNNSHDGVVLELSDADVEAGARRPAPALAPTSQFFDSLLPDYDADGQSARDSGALFDDWGPEVWAATGSFTPAPAVPPTPATVSLAPGAPRSPELGNALTPSGVIIDVEELPETRAPADAPPLAGAAEPAGASAEPEPPAQPPQSAAAPALSEPVDAPAAAVPAIAPESTPSTAFGDFAGGDAQPDAGSSRSEPSAAPAAEIHHLEAALQAIAEGTPQQAVVPSALLPALTRILLDRGFLAPRDLLGMVAAPADRACGVVVKVLFELGWLDALDLTALLGVGPERVCASLMRTLIGRARFTAEEVRRALG